MGLGLGLGLDVMMMPRASDCASTLRPYANQMTTVVTSSPKASTLLGSGANGLGLPMVSACAPLKSSAEMIAKLAQPVTAFDTHFSPVIRADSNSC